MLSANVRLRFACTAARLRRTWLLESHHVTALDVFPRFRLILGWYLLWCARHHLHHQHALGVILPEVELQENSHLPRHDYLLCCLRNDWYESTVGDSKLDPDYFLGLVLCRFRLINGRHSDLPRNASLHRVTASRTQRRPAQQCGSGVFQLVLGRW